MLPLVVVMENANTRLRIADLAPRTAVFALNAQLAVTKSATLDSEKTPATALLIVALAVLMEFVERIKAKQLLTVLKIVVFF